MSGPRGDDLTDGTTANDHRTSCVETMLNKRPRLLSFQGLSSHSRALGERDVAMPMASTSSSSLEHINRREQLANDLRSWQESQIAACIDDNILNMVLERYLVFFERRNNPNSAQQPVAANDDELFEDEAVRMAISARGLLPAATAAAAAAAPRADEMAGPSTVPSTSSSQPQAIRVVRDPVEQSSPGPSWPAAGRALQDNFILETAVAAAIQEKGLVTGSTERAGETSEEEEDDGR
ncbi:uncharacterized protein LOC121588164 [Anopheles merus]|uniref:Uncharacterized protein n=2 Tax=gambiae species complex TaxID=44542 RepID=A0A182V7H1_ANOME|nr:uncharacterized protein LOC121588164 [Anopheles merus]